MNIHDIPERPAQPPEPYEVSELQATVDGELDRIDMEDKYTRQGNLLDHVRKCVAAHAERIYDNADDVGMVTVSDHGRGYFISEDDYDELVTLIDDMKTIEKEGW